MSNFLTQVTLKDGSEVPLIILNWTKQNLESVKQQDSKALTELAKKCQDVNYKFTEDPFGKSRALLKTNFLIDKNEEVHPNVRKIVLNSIVRESTPLKWVDPLQSKQISKVESKANT